MRSFKAVTFLAVVLMLASAQTAAAQASYGTRCEVYPPHPTDSMPVKLIVSGQWSDSCAPRRATVQLNGNTIYMTLYQDLPAGSACLTVISDYSVSQTVGPLPAGQYTLRAVLEGPGTYPSPIRYYMPLCDSTFTVAPGSLVDCGWPDGITVTPNTPAWNTPVEFTAFGQCDTSCIPQDMKVMVRSGRVDLDILVPAYFVCPIVETPWQVSRQAPPINPGAYKIYVRRNGVPAEGYYMGSFVVKAGPYITYVSSVKLHAGRPLSVNGRTIEPRAGGPTEIEIGFSEPLMPLVATVIPIRVTGATLAGFTMLSPTVMRVNLVSPVQGTATLELLGLQNAEGIALQGSVVTLRGMVGDVTNDGRVNLADLSTIKYNFGKPAYLAPRCDINLSGNVDLADLSFCKSRFSTAAP